MAAIKWDETKIDTTKEFIHFGCEGGIGDVVMATNIAEAVRRKHPDAFIVAHPSHPEVFENNPHVDMIHHPHYDGCSPLDGNYYDNYILGFARGNTLKDFDKSKKAKVYKLGGLYGYVEYEMDTYKGRFVEMLAEKTYLKDHLRADDATIEFTGREKKKIERLMRSFGEGKFIMMQTSGSQYKFSNDDGPKLNKDWTHEHWVGLTNLLIEEGFKVIQVGLPHETPVIDADQDGNYRDGFYDMRGKLPLREIWGMMTYMEAYVNIDSMLAHIGHALNVCGVVMWGRSNPEFFGHKNNINLFAEGSCPDLFCGRGKSGLNDLMLVNGNPEPWECPNRKCMHYITPDRVYREILKAQTTNTKRKEDGKIKY